MGDVAVIFGGPSPEHDVSILTGLQAVRALAGRRTCHAIYWTKNGSFVLVDASLEAEAFAAGVPSGAQALQLRAGEGFVLEGRRLAKERPLDLDAAILCTPRRPG